MVGADPTRPSIYPTHALRLRRLQKAIQGRVTCGCPVPWPDLVRSLP